MSIQPNRLLTWHKLHFKERQFKTRNDILTSEAFNSVSADILSFVYTCIISSQPRRANQVLDKLLRVSEFKASDEEIRTLELFWEASKYRPENVPWERLGTESINEAWKRSDPTHAEFYETWMREYEFLTGHPAISSDPHQWKLSNDESVLATCAVLLCRATDGNVPNQADLEEGFVALEKLLFNLPTHSKTLYSHTHLMHIYFILAFHLRRPQKARQLLQIAFLESFLDDALLFAVPAFYTGDASNEDEPLNHVSAEDMKVAADDICSALATRAEKGRQEPLANVTMAELLSRFSEAAFLVRNRAYMRSGIKSSSEILKPPITASQILELETKLGPLPEDVKEMALIADGFTGRGYIANGGWLGIQSLNKVPVEEYEIDLGYEAPPLIYTEQRTNEDGTVYDHVIRTEYGIPLSQGGSPKQDFGHIFHYYSPDYEYQHILCPTETWKKIQEAKMEDYKEGEYRYFNFRLRNDGGNRLYTSVRQFLAEETQSLETAIAIGKKTPGGYADEDGFDDDGFDDDDEDDDSDGY